MGNEESVVKRLLGSMKGWKASDLFLTEGKRPAARIHGDVKIINAAVVTREDFVRLLDEAVLPSARKRLEEFGDLDVGFSLGDDRRFRFNFSRQQGLYGLVARALPTGDVDLAELGVPEAVSAFAGLTRGLVIIAGSTGAGKSTSLAGLIHLVNKTRKAHILTIEDPIEFVHRDIRSRVTQREVGTDTHSFHEALRHVVRQSPDLIVIGEIRDRETVEVALSAALTGHMVFATLHTVDVSQSLQRILSLFPEESRQQAAVDLSLALKGVLSQRLLPRIDGEGRVLSTEILTVSPTASRLIREQRIDDLQDYMRSTNDPGILTFNSSLLELHRQGRISYEIGLAYASNPDEFALAAQGMATGTGTFAHEIGLDASSSLDLKALLQLAIERGASDLHVTTGRPPILRIAGELRPLQCRALTTPDMRVLLFSIMSGRQRATFELEREIDFALAVDKGKRFRVNAYHQKGKLAASLRMIPDRIPEASELGLPDVVLELGRKPHGLLLVVGPTGSGKSTTLACLIQRINVSRACRIITVEDPIEYVYKSELATIDQRELGADTLTFSAALRNVLRQDPDVILVGEMRDAETTSAAITAGETGHLVMATLHTNDAVQAIDRIIDTFPPHQQPQVRSQLAAALLGVISQRLLLRATEAGRIAAFEVLVCTTAMQALIREGKMHQAMAMMETKRAEGMFTLDTSLKRLFDTGEITAQEAYRYLRNPKVITG